MREWAGRIGVAFAALAVVVALLIRQARDAAADDCLRDQFAGSMGINETCALTPWWPAIVLGVIGVAGLLAIVHAGPKR